MLKLFTDTDTDVDLEIAKKYGYNLISMPYSIEGKIIYPYVDFQKFEGHKFYESLRNGILPSTSGLNMDEYIAYFEPIFQAGDDILYVHFSSKMSSTFNNMNLAINELKEKYPERKFYTIDTKGITILSYLICLEIGKMYQEGKSIEEILAFADKEVLHYGLYFYADNLKFFKRSGRVNGISAFMGDILGIHPIIFIDNNGLMRSIGKERGRNRSLRKLALAVKKYGKDLQNHKIVIGHTDAIELANSLKEMLLAEIDDSLDIELVLVNPTAGCHCGPDGIGVAFYCTERKESLNDWS